MTHSSAQPTDSWTPLGWALADYLRQPDDVASMFVFMEDGERLPLPTSTFFRPQVELPETESLALEHCRGRILDLGAGAGAHSLLLQERGFEVMAADICPGAVEVMGQRGVQCTRLADHITLSTLPELRGRFDTLLMMMNGIGLVGEMSGLAPFFHAAHLLLGADGQILCDSTDLRAIDDDREQGRMRLRRDMGLYHGETRQRISYRGLAGEPFGWLYLDLETLSWQAERCGWACQVLFESDDGSYLARLVSSL